MSFFQGSREPALVLCVDYRLDARDWQYRFQLVHRNEIIARMWAIDAYRAIKWNGSLRDFIETWLLIQSLPYYSPQNPSSHFVKRKPLRLEPREYIPKYDARRFKYRM